MVNSVNACKKCSAIQETFSKFLTFLYNANSNSDRLPFECPNANKSYQLPNVYYSLRNAVLLSYVIFNDYVIIFLYNLNAKPLSVSP